MDRTSDKVIPVLTILAGLIVVWYVFAVILNAPFQRDWTAGPARRQARLPFSARRCRSRSRSLPAPHQVAINFFKSTFLVKPWSVAQPRLPRLGDAFVDAARLRLRHGARHPDRRRHRPCRDARPQPDAVDHRLADHPDPGHRADDHRGARRSRHHRPDPQGADLDLSVVLPGRGRHGQRPALARDHQSRPDAHLQCQQVADLLETARPGVGAVPVHLDEGSDCREPGRRHRRRTADRRGCRHRRQAAVRLLLQRHDRHVVGIGRRLGCGGPARGDRRHRRARWSSARWGLGRHERHQASLAGGAGRHPRAGRGTGPAAAETRCRGVHADGNRAHLRACPRGCGSFGIAHLAGALRGDPAGRRARRRRDPADAALPAPRERRDFPSSCCWPQPGCSPGYAWRCFPRCGRPTDRPARFSGC